jgi:hypothetical protein
MHFTATIAQCVGQKCVEGPMFHFHALSNFLHAGIYACGFELAVLMAVAVVSVVGIRGYKPSLGVFSGLLEIAFISFLAAVISTNQPHYSDVMATVAMMTAFRTAADLLGKISIRWEVQQEQQSE